MWTTANRPKYNRDKLRYPSDLTGEEWAHIEALIPAAKHGDRKRKVDGREVVNGRSKLCKQRLRRGMYVQRGVPMALCAQGPSTQEHALRLFRSLDLRRHRENLRNRSCHFRSLRWIGLPRQDCRSISRPLPTKSNAIGGCKAPERI